MKTKQAITENINSDVSIESIITGTEDTDELFGFNGQNDTIYGYGGGDILYGLSGDDWLDGGLGNDILEGGNGSDRLLGNVDDDFLYGEGGNDYLDGGLGNDTLSAGPDDDKLFGGDGDDDLFGDDGLDELNGGKGNDILHGDNWEDTLLGADGDDTLYGGEGYDDLDGGLGKDVLYGGDDGDRLTGGEGDTLIGGAGNDYYLIQSDSSLIVENNGEGYDHVLSDRDFTLPEFFESLELVDGSAAIYGTGNQHNNSIQGNQQDNFLMGLGGDDNLYGGEGNDSLSGGDGNDWLLDIQGNDWLLGGEGNDNLWGGGEKDTLEGGLGDDTYTIDSLDHYIIETDGTSGGIDKVISLIKKFELPNDIEQLTLGSARYIVFGIGNENDNAITGNTFRNVLRGQGGNDDLYAGAGADVVIGGLGEDKIYLAESGNQRRATDTVLISAGESLTDAFDVVSGFKLVDLGNPKIAADRLNLDNTVIATNTSGTDGVDTVNLHSHAITNGIITFDDQDQFSTALTLDTSSVEVVFNYLKLNIVNGETVAFIADGNTFVFQDNGNLDTAVQLSGVVASNINVDGLTNGGIWLI